MKKIFSLLFIATMFFSCRGYNRTVVSETNTVDSTLTQCKIIKIVNIRNYYLIYAKGTKNNIGYKIISATNPILSSSNSKTKNKKKSKIIVGNIYRFNFKWLSEPKEEDKIGNYLEFNRCIVFYPGVKICTEAGFELYEATNLSGLEILDSDSY